MNAKIASKSVAAVTFFFLAGGLGYAQLLELQEGQILHLKLDGPANTIAVGNAAVVDARIAFSDTVLLIGLRTGSTDIMAFDDAGDQIFSAAIAVVSPMDQHTVSVIGGTRRQTVVCRPNLCIQSDEPAQMISDQDSSVGRTSREVGQ